MQYLLFLFIFAIIMGSRTFYGSETLKAAIISNPLKDEGYAVAAQAAETLLQAGASVLVQQDALSAMPDGALAVGDEELYNCDFIVTLGGDGTILAVARSAAGRSPILGVNLGRKGFLTEVELPQMGDALRRAAAGDYTIENRMMLSAVVFDDKGAETCRALALNDFYASGTTSPRMVHVEASVDGYTAGTYSADGVLVSSPTGSTGYALSAGGPVVSPEVQCMVLMPVCAHTLSAVPLVIPAGDTVTVKAASPTKEIRLNADGEERARLYEGWRAEVKRADTDALFMRFGGKDFYGLLRDKLVEWNG
jgi:NAD+ kinase